MRRFQRLSAVCILLAILLATPVLAAPGDTTRVSVDSGGGQANAASVSAAISANGRYIAFQSSATNLVAGDTNGVRDIFVHDRATGETTRVSVSTGGGQGNGSSDLPSISSDGRFVAFVSQASNLVGGDTNGLPDIFVHDRLTGETRRVSVATGGGQGDNDSSYPSISTDRRYVAFQSWASNLVSGDTNAQYDIFIHDRVTGETTRVSVATGGGQGNNHSFYASISADGRYIAFWSAATNLVPGDTNSAADVFVHDRITGATTRVSVASGGAQGNMGSFYPSISADGRYIAFESDAGNLVPGDTNGLSDIFVHDRTTGTTTRVSITLSGAQGNGGSFIPSLSPDGHYVAFVSQASNLVGGDTNGQDDVFIHDRTTGIIIRASVASRGGQANSASSSARISSDGRYVAFWSWATNLVVGDTNGALDIFVHEMDYTPPTVVLGIGSLPPANGAILTTAPARLIIPFSENVVGNSSQQAANSPGNYMLLRPGSNGTFDTLVSSTAICDAGHMPVGDDERIGINGITYDAASFTATLTIAPLANGQYRLYVCGAASIQDLSGNPLNGGINTAIDFTVSSMARNSSSLPATGFALDRVTALLPQTVSYTDLGDLWLEIPKLGLKIPIVGVPKIGNEWDVSWLGTNAGWLEGSAFPSWAGNSVLTGHVWNADNSPGPFLDLNTLRWGDRVIVHGFGQQSIYEVRGVKLVTPTNVSAMLKHEELPWLTLVSCRGYDESTNSYRYRILVRAVLVEVK